MLEKVYRSLHHGSSEWEGRHYIHQDHNRVGEDMNCKEMARLIRSWLKDRKNLKVCQCYKIQLSILKVHVHVLNIAH